MLATVEAGVVLLVGDSMLRADGWIFTEELQYELQTDPPERSRQALLVSSTRG